MVAPFAADHVLFEDVALASTFEKGTVADSVATGFGKVSNQVLAHRPAAGRNDVNHGNWIAGVPRMPVQKNVVGEQPLVRVLRGTVGCLHCRVAYYNAVFYITGVDP